MSTQQNESVLNSPSNYDLLMSNQHHANSLTQPTDKKKLENTFAMREVTTQQPKLDRISELRGGPGTQKNLKVHEKLF